MIQFSNKLVVNKNDNFICHGNKKNNKINMLSYAVFSFMFLRKQKYVSIFY